MPECFFAARFFGNKHHPRPWFRSPRIDSFFWGLGSSPSLTLANSGFFTPNHRPKQPWLAMATFSRLVWITVVAVVLPMLMVIAVWTSVTSERSEKENLPRFDGWIHDENRIAILIAGSLQRFNLNSNLERLVLPLVRENWTVDLYLSIRMGKVQGWRQAADAFEPEGELKNLNQEGLETLLTGKVGRFGGTLVYQHIFDEIDLAVEDIDFIQNFGGFLSWCPFFWGFKTKRPEQESTIVLCKSIVQIQSFWVSQTCLQKSLERLPSFGQNPHISVSRPMTEEFHVFWPQRPCDGGETEFFVALERVAQPLVLCTGSGRSHGKLFLCNLDFD